MQRQTCARCLRTVGTMPNGEERSYVTREYDQRTPAMVRAGRAPIVRRFHFCPEHTPEVTR